jgi:hypothetical protein
MSTSGPIGEFEHESMVIVYDPATGEIKHTHRHSVSHGGQPPGEEALGAAALKFASQAGHDVAKASILHVDPRSLKPDAQYKVDTQKRVLVESKHPQKD